MIRTDIMAFSLGFGMVSLLCLATRPRPRAAAPCHVRVAGRREMVDPPPDWDEVDEALDESFPASDPPGTY